jgi:hypothetical protein
MKREQLLKDLQQRFEELFPPLTVDKWMDVDGYQLLSLRLQRKQINLLCAVEYRPTPDGLRSRHTQLKIEAHKRGHKGGVGVLTAYMSQPGLTFCESAGMACFDLNGTCLLAQKGTYIRMFASSNRLTKSLTAATSFIGNRVNVIRTLLSDKSRVWSVRTLADASYVSVGQVSKALKPLIAVDAVEAKRGTGGIRVKHPGNILDTWAEHYSPPGTALAYTSRDSIELVEERLVKRLTAAKLAYAFTGFSGNALLAASGRYTEASAYVVATEGQLQRIAAELGLIPALSAPKVVLRTVVDAAVLVGSSTIEGKMVASMAQVYVDLLSHPQRGAEAAQLLRTMVMKY